MTTMILRLRARRRGARAVPAAPTPAVVTRAELAECTCPEACERDHEQD